MVARKIRRESVQSPSGLLRALGASALPRARPIYRQLVARLEEGIVGGVLEAGCRLPAERDLAQALRLSRTTVVRAYRELEARGLVRGYVGRGTFVSARPDSSSAPFAWRGKVSTASLQATDSTVRDLMQAAGDSRLTSFAAGQPALECFPAREVRQALDRLVTDGDAAPWRNVPTEGHPRLREAIASRAGIAQADILVVAGAQQGLDLLARCLIDPGDAVVIDRPAYLGAIHSFRSAGARLVGWDVPRGDIDELEELLLRYRPKLVYLNPTYQNPTGRTLPLRLRREVLELAVRYRVPIVEDDTYRELSLGSTPPPALFDLDEERQVVIHLNTFSKTVSPGLRLGWIAAVPPIVEQLALIKQRVDLHTPTLTQLVVAELLETGAFDRHLGRLRAEHRRRRDAMVRALRSHMSAEQLGFDVPDGGLYLWCRLSERVLADEVRQLALRDAVVFVTGQSFYCDHGGAHELRICFAGQPPEHAGRAAAALSRGILARTIHEARLVRPSGFDSGPATGPPLRASPERGAPRVESRPAARPRRIVHAPRARVNNAD
jgi:DNA-binding transcriptional MocR family regulator